MFKEICRKWDPSLETFGPKIQPYGRHIPVPLPRNVPTPGGDKLFLERHSKGIESYHP